jgi:hypothetical protein
LTRPRTLLISAYPFGYGPGAKAIALAAALRPDWRVAFVGTGSAMELVSRAPDAFDEIVEGRAGERAAKALLADAWGVLSVMDRDAGLAAAHARKPLFVVDSLLFMRRAVPAALRGARCYWAQRFPDLVPAAYEPRPVVVGPLVAGSPPAATGPRAGLVVHLGGSAAPDDRRGLYASYARFVARAVDEARLVDRFGSVGFVGGAGAESALDGVAGAGRSSVEALRPAEARARMAGAAAVLTAPGLTATLECFRDGTPTWFLPPQNYSQWLVLRALRRLGAAPDAFHWEECDGVPRLEARMDPEAYEPVVRESIGRLSEDPAVERGLAGRLTRVGADADRVVEAQSALFRGLGPDGVATIVADLRRLSAGEPASARFAAAPAVGSGPSARERAPWT